MSQINNGTQKIIHDKLSFGKVLCFKDVIFIHHFVTLFFLYPQKTLAIIYSTLKPLYYLSQQKNFIESGLNYWKQKNENIIRIQTKRCIFRRGYHG